MTHTGSSSLHCEWLHTFCIFKTSKKKLIYNNKILHHWESEGERLHSLTPSATGFFLYQVLTVNFTWTFDSTALGGGFPTKQMEMDVWERPRSFIWEHTRLLIYTNVFIFPQTTSYQTRYHVLWHFLPQDFLRWQRRFSKTTSVEHLGGFKGGRWATRTENRNTRESLCEGSSGVQLLITLRQSVIWNF